MSNMLLLLTRLHRAREHRVRNGSLEMVQIKLNFTKENIRSSMRAYWWKQIGPIFPIVALFLTVFTAYLFFTGDRSWIVGALAAILVIAYLTMAATYLVHLRRSLARFYQMKEPTATLELHDKGFRVISDIGESELNWSTVKEVWCLDPAWLFNFSAGGLMTVPSNDLSSEAKAFIVARAEQHGIKVV